MKELDSDRKKKKWKSGFNLCCQCGRVPWTLAKIKMMNRLKDTYLDCKGTTLSWAHNMEEYFRNDRGKILLSFYAL